MSSIRSLSIRIKLKLACAFLTLITIVLGAYSIVNLTRLNGVIEDLASNQISRNIDEINEVVHDAARGAKETASAAARLARLSDDLRGIVGRFSF